MSDSSVTRGPVGEGDWRRTSPTLVARASFLLNSEELSDVRFIFNKNEEREETTIYGHKLILAMGSPVFNKMFFCQYQEFTTTVENEVGMGHQMFTPEAFLTFIKFLYTDKIDFKNLSTEIIVGVLHCADYYDVPYLKMDCGKELEKIIKMENVIQVLEAGDLFRMKDLIEKTLVFIDQNIKFVFESEEILSAKMETLVLILKRDSLDVDECFVLDLALKWAGMECGRQNLRASEENKRKVLGKVLLEIRFGLLTSDRISELVHSNVLTREESLDVVLDVHTPGPGYVTTTCISDSKRRRLAPEVRFKSNPRIFGQKKKLMGIQDMEKKWKQNNNCQYLKAILSD